MINFPMTTEEAEKIKAALDFLIGDSNDSELLEVTNRLNEYIKENS